MATYASDPDTRPDSEFEPGTLRHIAVGARGRMLDARRTPVSVVEVQPHIGFVRIRVEDFEDEGAIWQVPLEEMDRYQFEIDGKQASTAAVAEMEAAIERFAREHYLQATAMARRQTEARIEDRRTGASAWLETHSRFLAERQVLPDPSSRRGDPLLAADLEAHLDDQGLWDVEDAFTRGFVSNPGSGEVVKGHRIVLAELGLADFSGSLARDPATFAGGWTRERRAEHIVTRIAFVRALYARLGLRAVTLWRGVSTESRLRRRPGRTFVSTSFDEAVARSHYEDRAGSATHVLVRQDVPVERLFMTYHETAAMNTIFLEAEAVVLARPRDGWP